jgi:uncharacterized protein (DUF1499 family)
LRYYLHESRKAVWSQRIALLFLLLFAITFGLHRVGELPTPVAMKLFGAALIGAVIAVGLGFVALAGIWREGYTGAGKAVAGLAFGALMLAGPLWSLPDLLALPRLHEVSTDVDSPPPFQKLAAQRKTLGANPSDFQRKEAALQTKAYPDIKPLPVNRPTADTYSAVREAVKTLNWTIVAENPPADGRTGLIEATDRSRIFGFTDDVVIRVAGAGRSARVDVRSSARHGNHDLGRNAQRVRVLFSEVKTRLSELEKTETMEKAVALREMRMKKALEKKEREREIAEREERRRQQQRAAAISRERQISSNENAGQGAAVQQSRVQSPPGAQDARAQNKQPQRVRTPQGFRKFWELLGQ